MATFFLILIYFAFISLGLPDSLLGASWPVMQPGFRVPFSYAGLASMVISGGTIVSSLLSGRVIQRFGTGKVTFVSVLMTAVALLGFSLAPSFAWVILAAVPLGLGAGSVDAGLNGYVAEHYKARHMSWLHSFWGVGAMTGPLMMAGLIAQGQSWRSGYLAVSVLQFALAAVLFFSLPLWARASSAAGAAAAKPALARRDTRGLFFPLQIEGVRYALITFLFYCGVETTVGLWGSSYLVHMRGLDAATAAGWISAYYASITAGRMLVGFVTLAVKNKALIRAGQALILGGVLLLFLPLPPLAALAGLILIGLGCAPIFPAMLHETPARFGRQDAQLVMGFQMASAYIGTTFLPPLFGFVANRAGLALLPVFLLVYIGGMAASSEGLNRLLAKKAGRAEEPEPAAG